jgi:hypothetical protein
MTTKGWVRPGKAVSVSAMIVGLVLVVIGISTVIPNFGGFGIIWTLAALGIVLYYAINAFSDHGVAEEVVEIDMPSQSKPDARHKESTEERLKKLEELKGKGLLNDDEYKEQRKKILGDL